MFAADVSEVKHLSGVELNLKLGRKNSGTEHLFSLKHRAPVEADR